MTSLTTPLSAGPITYPNRVFMAPMSRMRCDPDGVPGDLNVAYYSQRAGAGLIISDATPISAGGVGYANSPRLYNAAQIAGWRRVTEAVHAAGGRIFLQMWHVGRISHSSVLPDGRHPVAPSPLAAGGTIHTPAGALPYEVPHALDLDDIAALIEEFRNGARMAQEAGFDGVEVQCANGYLLEQFLNDQTNRRSDAYGGSVENRSRLLLEVLDAVTGVWDSQRVGVRISPFGSSKDCFDSNPFATHIHLARRLNACGLAYLHIYEPRAVGAGMWDTAHEAAPIVSPLFRQLFTGPLIAAGGFTPETANAAIADGTLDAVAFGRLFISNPDLPRRIALSQPLSAYDKETFYSGGSKGYTDYPAFADPA